MTTFSKTVQTVCQLSGEQPPNQDAKTGIHYGVIPGNSCHWIQEDIFEHGNNDSWEAAQGYAKEALLAALSKPDFYHGSWGDIKENVTQLLDSMGVIFASYTLSEYDNRLIRDVFGVIEDLIVEKVEEGQKEVDFAKETAETLWEMIEDRWNDHYQSDSDTYSLDYGEYHFQLDSYNDIFVLRSPYYTICDECSPCAPNAGYLSTPSSGDNTLKTYCLHPDCFDEDEGEEVPYDKVYELNGSLIWEKKDGK